jgi:hypothetical protein
MMKIPSALSIRRSRQGDVGDVSDVDAVDEDHPRGLALAPGGA